LIFILLLFSCNLFSQSSIPKDFLVKLASFNDNQLLKNNLLTLFSDLIFIEQPYSLVTDPQVRKIRRFSFSTMSPAKLDSVMTFLSNCSIIVSHDTLSEVFSLDCQTPLPINDPKSADEPILDLMQVPYAWCTTKGDPNLKIAIIDQFLNFEHQELQGQIASITPPPGPNGEPTSLSTFNSSSLALARHGFAMAGKVVALENNASIVGVAPNCKISFYSVGSSFDGGNPYLGLEAILNEEIEGIPLPRVINVSYTGFGGGGVGSTPLIDILNMFTARGTVIVKAVINQTDPNASFANIDGVITAMFTDYDLVYQNYDGGEP
jgi:subtilisin family serine protease